MPCQYWCTEDFFSNLISLGLLVAYDPPADTAIVA
jgi:hypothetical protein